MKRESPRTLHQALFFIDSYLERATQTMQCPVRDVRGRVLAEDIIAPASLPRFDSAAMDGFTVRSADIGPDGLALLKLSEVIAAGPVAASEPKAGETARVMIGAIVPAGTKRVVIQELAEVIGNQVRFNVPKPGKAHIRQVGEDVREGTPVLSRGTRINAGHKALLIALGIRSIAVYARPKVALLSTGDELVDDLRPLSRGEIYDTNWPMLSILLENAGAEVTDLGIIRDDPGPIVSTLVTAAADHDFIVSSGNASAGFADHLAKAVRQRGYLEFWKLDMRPGKPVGFGDIDHCPILLLPGNPVAAASGFAIIGRFILDRPFGAVRWTRSPAATDRHPAS